jgi:hypothetical protein
MRKNIAERWAKSLWPVPLWADEARENRLLMGAQKKNGARYSEIIALQHLNVNHYLLYCSCFMLEGIITL